MQSAENNPQVICVTTKDCPRNDEFKGIVASLHNGRIIDFYTQDMDDLGVIAKYRILPVPTFLVVSNNRVLARIVHPPAHEQLLDLLHNIPSIFR